MEKQFSAIDATGYFKVDVSALIPPFVIYAEGVVDGKWVRLFSAIQKPGRVNVTTATDVIMAMGLGEDPENYYSKNPTAAPPTDTELALAEQEIRARLEMVFSTLDVPLGFDLMNGDFIADGTGADLMLNVVDMNSNAEDNTVTLVDKTTGAVLYERQVDTGTVTVDLDASKINTMVQGTVSLLDALNELLVASNEYLSASDPTQNPDLLITLDSQRADDYLNNGLTKYDERVLDLTGRPENKGYLCESVTIYRQMKVQHLGDKSFDEKGITNFDGYWCSVNLSFNGEPSGRILSGFIQKTENGPWQWYGNRKPVRGYCDIHCKGVKYFYAARDVSIYTGYHIEIHDVGNVGLNIGIDTVAIVGDGITAKLDPNDALSSTCLLLKRNIDTHYYVHNVESEFWPNVYTTADKPGLLTPA